MNWKSIELGNELKAQKMTEEKKMKIEFAPGCFDNFEGTQEELDELVAHIQSMVDSGEMVENNRQMTEEEFEELPDEAKEALARFFLDEQNLADEFKRKLQ